jgi:hypothetical protein
VRAMAAGTGLRTAKLCKYLINKTNVGNTAYIYAHIIHQARGEKARALTLRCVVDQSHA